MDTIKVLVITGSIREGRFADKPAAWIMEELKKTPGIDADLIDLKTLNLPRFNYAGFPSMVQDGNYGNDQVNAYAKQIAAADAFIVVTPEYNHGYSGALKDAIDWVYAEWNKKPIGFVSYGSVGGGRVIEQLREVVVELQMAPIRNSVHMPMDMLMSGLKEGAGADFALFKPLEDKAKGLIEQLVWWAKALKTARGQ